MTALSGVTTHDFHGTAVLQKISERFQALDSDRSGSLDKTEMIDARSRMGLDTSRIDKIFRWLDADGDGLVTQDEHRDRLLAVAERRGLVSRPDIAPEHTDRVPSGGYVSQDVPDARKIFAALTTLMNTVDDSPGDATEVSQLRELSLKLEAEGLTEENLSALMSFLTAAVPPIDLTA